jgi:tetratricopeptide (TPR) repeat protein
MKPGTLKLFGLLLVGGLFLTPLGGWAQTHAETPRESALLSQQVLDLFKAGRYQEALPLAQRDLALRERMLGPEHPSTATALNNLAELYKGMGAHGKALPLLQRALAIVEKALGPEHLRTVAIIDNLAGLHVSMGAHEKALPLVQRALKIREKALGPEHPDTATSLNELAMLHHAMGAHEKALPLVQRALKIREKVLGPAHRDTATSLDDLATIHHAMGATQKALPLAQRALKIWEKVAGPGHRDTAISVNNLGMFYHAVGAYEKALPLLQRALAIREKVLGPAHPDTAQSLYHLAMLYKDRGTAKKALPLAQRALKIYAQALGPEHPTTVSTLTQVATLHKAMGDYRKALPLSQRELAIREKTQGPEHPDTAASLNRLGALYWAMGAYRQAEPLYQRALKIREKVSGPDHPDTAAILNNLATLYLDMGAHAQALALYQQALKIMEKAPGAENQSNVYLLNNLADLHRAMGAYEKALPLYERALQIREQVLGPEHPDTAMFLDNLGALHLDLGAYDRALSLHQRAHDILAKAVGPEHPDTVKSLNNLATVYQNTGAYEEALSLLQRALQIREKVLGPEHPDTAASVNNLATLYQAMGAYDQALPLYKRALAAKEKVLGPEHPDTAKSLNNLATLYQNIGAHDQALPLHQRALAIREKALGPEHPETAASLTNLAALYQDMGAYDQALSLHMRALAINEKALGPKHPDTANSLTHLGHLYLERKEYKEAESYFTRSTSQEGLLELYLATGRYQEVLGRLEKFSLSAYAPPLSTAACATHRGRALAGMGRRGEAATQLVTAIREIEHLRKRVTGPRTGFFQIKKHREAYLQLTAVLGDMAVRGEPLPPALEKFGPHTAAAGFYCAEATKGRVLLEEMAATAAARSGLGQIPAELARQERELLQRLEALEANWEKHYTRGEEAVAAFRKQREALQQQLDELVAELRQKYPRYAALKYPQPLRPQEIPLKADEVLLEYALGEKGSYLFRVDPGGRTQVYAIPMGQEELATLVTEFITSLKSPITGGEFNPALGERLYDLLLAAVLKDLALETRLIIVPDGILGLLPFEALVVKAGKDQGDTRYVGDERLITYCQSAAILALNRLLPASQATKPFFALGHPIYSPQDPRYLAYKQKKKAPILSAQAALPYAFRALATHQEWGRTTSDDKEREELHFVPLPETEAEVKALAGLFGVNPEPPHILLHLAANETRLKQTPLKDYHYLHFATHADLPGKVQGVKEPFILLGQVENQGKDNGLLTMSEVLGMQLDAQLVVLSACLTGRGKVMAGEGVANMARAFQQAGARSVVVSLWEVASEETVEFMVTFYGHLKAGKPKAEALRLARQHIKAKYPEPFYWAVFILHGEG